MDFHLLSNVVEELSALLSGGRVERVYQDRNRTIYLVVRRDRKDHVLLISPDRALPRMHIVSKKPAAADPPHGFVLYLRSHLNGTRVAEIRVVNHDRVVELRFTSGDGEYLLIVELFGSTANCVLTDPAYTILAVYYPVALGDGVKRPLLPGLQYALPEKKARRPGKVGSRLAPGDLRGRDAGKEFSPNNAAEQYYTILIQQTRLSATHAEISSVVKKALSKAERRVAAVSGDLISAEKADEYRQAGDLILANLKSIPKGADQAELSGYDGRSVIVRLDPKRSAARNAEACFRRYKKSKAGFALITKRLDEAAEEAAFLRSLQSELKRFDDEDTLARIRSKLAAKGYPLQGKGRSSEKAAPPAVTPGYRKFAQGSWEIFVGKSAAGNDYITMKLARPDDLWLHAEGMPGSHVLVKNPEGREIPSEVLTRAASLAAYYSKGRSAGKVPVAYTFARFVKKPRGAKPGMVMLSERKTIMAAPAERGI